MNSETATLRIPTSSMDASDKVLKIIQTIPKILRDFKDKDGIDLSFEQALRIQEKMFDVSSNINYLIREIVDPLNGVMSEAHRKTIDKAYPNKKFVDSDDPQGKEYSSVDILEDVSKIPFLVELISQESKNRLKKILNDSNN